VLEAEHLCERPHARATTCSASCAGCAIRRSSMCAARACSSVSRSIRRSPARASSARR
jgi:hypothetical protein